MEISWSWAWGSYHGHLTPQYHMFPDKFANKSNMVDKSKEN